MIELIKNLH